MSSIVDSTQRSKQVFWIILGVFITTFGQYYFLLPDNILGGGAAGMAMLFTSFVNLPYSIVLLVLNAILLILGIVLIDRSFGGMTLFAVAISTGLVALFDFVFPVSQAITNDTMLNMFFGNLLMAIGIGWVFNASASTGGTDILGYLLKKYFHVTFSTGTLIVNLAILLGTFSIFGIDRGLYATFGVIFQATVLNRVIAGGEGRFQITIMTSEVEAINSFILSELNRSTTLYHAEGGYQRKPRLVIISIVDGRQLLKIKQFVHQTDPNAFFYVNSITDISGLGFTINYPVYSNVDSAKDEGDQLEDAKKLERAEHVKPYAKFRAQKKKQQQTK